MDDNQKENIDIKELEVLANEGDASAQYDLAKYYYDLEEDEYLELAVKWLKKSAEQDYTKALFDLAILYEDAYGVEEDYEMAMNLFFKAAEKGYTKALTHIADCYFNGEILNCDGEKAYEYYKKAANLGDAYGQYMLAKYFIYEKFDENKRAEIEAEYYKKSADQGFAPAQYELSLLYENGRGVEKNHEKYLELLNKAAEQDYEYALMTLGTYYYEDKEVSKRDFIKAIELCMRAAKQFNQIAGTNLNNVWELPIDNKYQDPIKIAEFLKELVKEGRHFAERFLGDCYLYGYGVKQDYLMALDLYNKASKGKNKSAANSIAYCYFYGLGVKQDYEKAYNWCNLVAYEDDCPPKFLCNLAYLYYVGKGTERNLNAFSDLVSKADNQGDIVAKYYVGLASYYGLGFTIDYERAFSKFEEAATDGNLYDAKLAVIECYKKGIGVEKNLEKAAELEAKLDKNGKTLKERKMSFQK